jgi:thiamine-phosphate pyrophosphorylase
VAEVCLITDRRRSRGRPLAEIAAAAVAGGVRIIQVREKDLPARELASAVRAVLDAALEATGVRVFVNDRLDVALATDAAGVHLGAGSIPVRAARRIAPDLTIGYSAHALDEAREAEDAGADYVSFGPVFETRSEGGRHLAPRGLDALAEVCGALRIPVFALGGVTAERVPDVIAVGAAVVAVVSAITEAPDVEAAAREIVRVARTAKTPISKISKA